MSQPHNRSSHYTPPPIQSPTPSFPVNTPRTHISSVPQDDFYKLPQQASQQQTYSQPLYQQPSQLPHNSYGEYSQYSSTMPQNMGSGNTGQRVFATSNIGAATSDFSNTFFPSAFAGLQNPAVSQIGMQMLGSQAEQMNKNASIHNITNFFILFFFFFNYF